MMKILNLYAGVGGNRMLWGDKHEITAVEFKDIVVKIVGLRIINLYLISDYLFIFLI